MLRLLSDEDAHGHVVRGLLRRQCPDLDLVRVQDVGLMDTPDTEILEWAAQHDRAVLTDDASTMTVAAYQRLINGQPMPGMFVLRDGGQVKDAIEAILFIAQAGEHQEWAGRVEFIPF